jgi:hypothetical protein
VAREGKQRGEGEEMRASESRPFGLWIARGRARSWSGTVLERGKGGSKVRGGTDSRVPPVRGKREGGAATISG